MCTKKPALKKGGKRGGKKKKAPAKSGSPDEKPKGRPKPEIKWTEEDLKKAIALVKSGESVWKISRQYGIKYDVLASATKISYYGLMYSKCKGEPTSKEKKKDKSDEVTKNETEKETDKKIKNDEENEK